MSGLDDSYFAELRPDGSVAVDQVVDPLRIRLRNGKTVQLVGLEIPDLDPYEPGETSRAARDRLRALLENKQVRLYVTRNAQSGRVNRMGDQLAHVVRSPDGLWIQGALLAEGLARVRPSARNTEMAARMIAQEDLARAAGTGLWADGAHPVLNPDNAGNAVNRWGVVEGTIRSVSTANNVIYLNFGHDWRSDFTISLPAAVRREMAKQGVNPMNLGGETVRVRGWIESYNGPHIRLLDPVWMEIGTTESRKP